MDEWMNGILINYEESMTVCFKVWHSVAWLESIFLAEILHGQFNRWAETAGVRM